MRRRELILGFGGAFTRPLATLAQQKAMPVIGFLHFGSSGPFAFQVASTLPRFSAPP